MQQPMQRVENPVADPQAHGPDHTWHHRLIIVLKHSAIFKARRDAVNLLCIALGYWLFAVVFWQESAFSLLVELRRLPSVAVPFVMLTLVGVFVAAYELAHPMLHRRSRATRSIIDVLAVLICAAIVVYWVEPRLFTALIAMSLADPLSSAAGQARFAAGNLTMVVVNILLPFIGGAYLVRTVHYALAGHQPPPARVWYTPEDLKKFAAAAPKPARYGAAAAAPAAPPATTAAEAALDAAAMPTAATSRG
ncbi:MAG: hypothetical protein JO032_18530 [Alphaproteobacteria bacterium]|nr:hypothetical protein [Alphaproteobacteria bacterium]